VDTSKAHHAHLLFRGSLLNTTIHCRDKLSGEVVKNLVVDCGTSALRGNYYGNALINRPVIPWRPGIPSDELNGGDSAEDRGRNGSRPQEGHAPHFR
jgi:hypothetical protein